MPYSSEPGDSGPRFANRFTSAISGINSDAITQYGGIGGGTDIENDNDLRRRILYIYQNPVSLYNVAAITVAATSISGVTRVWVFEITPDLGQTSIYFVRDNDDDIIPSPVEVAEVKNKLIDKDYGIKPANTADIDVIVLAPTPVTVPFIFSALDPNTATMQKAITNNLKQFFREETNIGENIPKEAYISAIYQTIDLDTGDRLKSFTLTSPTTDITIDVGQLGVLGMVTYP